MTDFIDSFLENSFFWEKYHFFSIKIGTTWN